MDRAVEMRAVEIRSYALQPGTRNAFHALMRDRAVPMRRRWEVDVVAYGPSPHAADSYYLIRGDRDVAQRQASQDAFYGGDEWRSGPRAAILRPILHFTSIVLSVVDAAIDALRATAPPTPAAR